MTKAEFSSTAPPRCYLLELPGELRNCIYEYLREDTSYKLKLVPSPYATWSAQYTSPRRCKEWKYLKRQTLGFTQTCRVIRHEFLPQHQSPIIVHLRRSEDVQQYITDFFLSAEAAHGRCYLRKPPTWWLHDVLTLIRALNSAPGLLLQFTSMSSRDRTIMSAFIDTKENKIWGGYVKNYVTGIFYYGDWLGFNPDQHLFIEIKHTSGEPWMLAEDDDTATDEAASAPQDLPSKKPKCVKMWLEMVGLSDLDKELDSVQIKVAEPEKTAICQTIAT